MGVRGLTPFLQKNCPDVLKKLPSRLQSLRGKKIVLDGTLITQRFHFMRRDHPYRHILGWYRLAQELNENGVSAICVFDGKERQVAKAKEVERRQAVRQLAQSRGGIERERFQRLRQLKEGIEIFQNVSFADKQQVFMALSDLPNVEYCTSTLLQQGPPNEPKDEIPSLTEESPPDSHLQEMPHIGHTALPITPDQLPNHFRSLNIGYKAAIAKLFSASIDSTGIPIQPAVSAGGQQASQTVTKKQFNLTIQEGELWNALTQSSEYPTADLASAMGEKINSLVEESYMLSMSFDRRSNRPTQTIYNQSKDVLRAMGIPCIDATGAVEAEALASAIVLNGHADFVASEDTDVLVYEAPLMKNITSYSEPIVLVSGSDIRNALGLSREAYVDLAVLMGTDFSDRIKNIGPVHAYQYIKEYGTIERIIEFVRSDTKFITNLSWETYLARVNIARLVFNTLPAIPPLQSLQAIEKDDQEVTKILGSYGLGFTQMAGDTWDYEAVYQLTLGGNYFSDAPAVS
ncbi:hypothetical protein GALMADRAFT_62412 [Galerina marginata CBS 339.88]|uniref:Exonuclease 1 n=1 Tax=Galerina marginata (strain CBS 339.88) TaxID=685588 RepID=A0A067TCN0_GALM3|nr:hypothetical protein GALMADRAFT_62412 [Galerina marginata CBS 339.88]